jgi:hypothetical protein
MIIKTCAECGGRSLAIDATAEWSAEANTWVLIDVDDKGWAFCDDCDVERLVTDEEVPTEMVKVVYNACFGSFGLSHAAMTRYAKLAGVKASDVDVQKIPRTDPHLVAVVEKRGAKANTALSAPCIRELPKGTRYTIWEECGKEYVRTIDEHDWSIA